MDLAIYIAQYFLDAGKVSKCYKKHMKNAIDKKMEIVKQENVTNPHSLAKIGAHTSENRLANGLKGDPFKTASMGDTTDGDLAFILDDQKMIIGKCVLSLCIKYQFSQSAQQKSGVLFFVIPSPPSMMLV